MNAKRRMGIRAPKPFDPKRGRKFETWLDRIEYYLMVTKCPDENRTACIPYFSTRSATSKRSTWVLQKRWTSVKQKTNFETNSRLKKRQRSRNKARSSQAVARQKHRSLCKRRKVNWASSISDRRPSLTRTYFYQTIHFRTSVGKV